jgi:hypothetical protein
MTHTLLMPVHVCLAYASCWRSLYVATFHTNPTELDRFTTPDKKCSRLYLSAWLSGPRVPPQFLSQHSHWSSALKPNICRQQTTRLTGPISPTCDRYVQYLLMGANPSVLNRHRRGLQPCRCWLANTTSRPSQPTILHFPPSGPAQSQVINY